MKSPPQSVGVVIPLSEHVYCETVTFKMTERVEQWIHIRFCVKLKHSSMKTIRMIQKTTAMGNWWLAASSWQRASSRITSCAAFFGETSNHPGGSGPPLQPRFGALWLLAFSNTKINFEMEEISDHWWDSGKDDGAADGAWENCVRSQGAYFEGTVASLSYVQCFLYLASSSINVSFSYHMAG